MGGFFTLLLFISSISLCLIHPSASPRTRLRFPGPEKNTSTYTITATGSNPTHSTTPVRAPVDPCPASTPSILARLYSHVPDLQIGSFGPDPRKLYHIPYSPSPRPLHPIPSTPPSLHPLHALLSPIYPPHRSHTQKNGLLTNTD